MTIDPSRRGILGLLTGAATAIHTLVEAAKKALLGEVGAVLAGAGVSGEVSDAANHGKS